MRAKAAQTALDELDWPCSVGEITGRFMPNARAALGRLPAVCFDSVERVATALADGHRDAAIPTGYGGACVRHFARRNDQLEQVLAVPVDSRFALIEISSLASILGRWGAALQPRVTVASYKECLRDVARLAPGTAPEPECWRAVIQFLLDRPNPAPALVRQIACALVWCGYFSPVQPETRVSAAASDAQLARHFFRIERATFVRHRTDALHWLPQIRAMLVLLRGGAVS